jgi:periplasmic divalent cation tolerance protein
MSVDMSTLIFFYVPCPDEAMARQIGRQMIEARLAACSNVWGMSSQYVWAGAFNNDQEWSLLLKTTSTAAPQLAQALALAHPYEVPCIAQWPVQVNAAYAKWVEEQLTLSNKD